MRIIIITNNSNGLFLFRRQLISSLLKSGNEVIALTPFDSDIENLCHIGVTLIDTPIDRRGINIAKDYSLFKRYWRELKRLKPDLVITYTIKPNIYGGIISRKQGIIHAANITGLGSAFERGKILRRIVTILYKLALNNTKVVFFENTSDRDFFAKRGIVKKDQTKVLSGAGVDLEYFNYQPYPKNNGMFKFLFIGRVMKEKGIEELLYAMKRLINEGLNCSLDILGSFEEDYKEVFEKYEAEGWLHYHGNQSDVRPFIANAHCFVLPSYHEGMANTNLECASSGRPVITSNIPGCKEAIIDGSGVLCEPQNIDSLYQAMRGIMDMETEELEIMGKRGRLYMEEVFDKKKVVKQTMEELFK